MSETDKVAIYVLVHSSACVLSTLLLGHFSSASVFLCQFKRKVKVFTPSSEIKVKCSRNVIFQRLD